MTESEKTHLLSLNSISCCHNWKDNSAVDVPLVSHIGDTLYSCPSGKNTMPCSLSGESNYCSEIFSHTGMQDLLDTYDPQL